MLGNGRDGLEYGGVGTFRVVEEYRKYPVLWRSSDKSNKSGEIRKNAVQELGEKYLR
jgi:hypothetical protein